MFGQIELVLHILSFVSHKEVRQVVQVSRGLHVLAMEDSVLWRARCELTFGHDAANAAKATPEGRCMSWRRLYEILYHHLTHGIALFNHLPKEVHSHFGLSLALVLNVVRMKGLDYLFKQQVILEEPASLLHFLTSNKDLNPRSIGTSSPSAAEQSLLDF